MIYLIDITHSFLSLRFFFCLFVCFVLFCFCFERERERGGGREREREFHANEQFIHLRKSISLLTLFEIFCRGPHLFQCNQPIPTTTFITIMIVTTIYQIFFILYLLFHIPSTNCSTVKLKGSGVFCLFVCFFFHHQIQLSTG